MGGYIIELYKNIISNDGSAELQEDNKNLKKNAYITFGDFDRMAVSTTTAFSRMRDMSKLSRTWKGDRQTILLYELSDDNEVIYKDTDADQGFFCLSQGREKKCEELFVGVTILQFKNNPTEGKRTATEYINSCREKILQIVEKNKTKRPDIHCSVLGILGSYGVAVIWTANQYTEVLELINIIKGTEISSDKNTDTSGYPYLSVYTIFAKNNVSKKTLDKRSELIKGSAILHMTLQTNLDQNIFKVLRETLGNDAQYHSVGEHDLIIIADSKKIYGLFENKAILDRDGSFHKQYILQMNTKLCREVALKDIEQDLPSPLEKKFLSPEYKRDIESAKDDSKIETQILDSYQNLRQLFFEKFPKTAGMVDSLDLLYGDYLSKTASVSNKMWTDDFKYQFCTILELIYKNLKIVTEDYDCNIKTTDALEDIREILNCFEYQIIHIAESNNLVLDTPKCHLRYTGQNNLALYAYFGIVKDILGLVYKMQGMSRQFEIIPLISADTVPIIKSTLFAEYGNNFTKGILKLNLPMMALYNTPVYKPYLYHEIFHYAVPQDRVLRNWYKGNILLIQAMKNFILNIVYFHCKTEDMKFTEGLVDNILMPFVYETVITFRHDEIPAKLNEKNLKRKIFNQGGTTASCSWKQYEKLLFQKIYNYFYEITETNLSRNIAYQVLRCFYLNRDKILSQSEKWLKRQLNMNDSDHPLIEFEEVQSFINKLEALVKNINGKKNESYYALIKSIGLPIKDLIDHAQLDDISASINEAVCDVAMVELAGMGAAEYLLSYVKIQNDLLKSYADSPQIQDVIRIGVVLDKIYGFDEKAENIITDLRSEQENFVNLYIGLYFSIHRFGEAEDTSYLDHMAKDAKAWFDKIMECYKAYAYVYRIQISMIKSVINQYNIKERLKENGENNYDLSFLSCQAGYDAMKTYGSNIRLSYKKSPSSFSEELLKEIKRDRQTFREKTFAMNIKFIQRYQLQKNFGEMSNLCSMHFHDDEPYRMELKDFVKSYGEQYSSTGYNMKKREYWETADYTYDIYGIEELCSAIKDISRSFTERDQKIYANKSHNLWYRGQGNIKYKLLPSAMRRLENTVQNSKDLRRYQREKYEEFKFRLDDASEHIDTSSYTSCDYLALMQHYGVPTVYLDWSENAITALYFALEAYIDPKMVKEKNYEDAVLYIMHPNLYNEARKDLMNTVLSISSKQLDYDIKETIEGDNKTLPNLSVHYNQEKYYMFLLGELDEKNVPDQPLKNESLTENSDSLLYLPLAVYSSRANMRVRNQYGMFMAFNLFTPPDKETKFSYMALEKIQEAYLKLFLDKEPFMYKIAIKNECKQRIADWLKAIGMSKDMIYPELSNIGERI